MNVLPKSIHTSAHAVIHLMSYVIARQLLKEHTRRCDDDVIVAVQITIAKDNPDNRQHCKMQRKVLVL